MGEVDWLEANGGCGGATTLHTVSGTGGGACNYWGCRTTYSFGSSTFHVKVEYGNDGKLTITRDGQVISGDSFDPPASGNDWGIVKSTYESKGGVIYSSQWTGSWVPADFCGGGPGDLDGSHFAVSNLRISGSVVQGPEPQICSGPQPSPSPSPPPSPSPSPPPSPPSADVYCPNADDLIVAYGDGVQIQDGGWDIQGDGGAATKAAFNLLGGYVEFDFDVSSANTGVIPNIYTVSPEGIGEGFSSDQYCDDGENDKPDCLEVDWLEANGGCGGATTLHTVSGTGGGACNYWGCRSTYSFGSSTFHVKVEYGNDGKFTITRDGQQISGDSLDPPASGNDWGIVQSNYQSKGGVIYSSQWTGSWVPADFCGGGPGDLGGSHFSVSNLRISGSVVQGSEPQKCSGPQPTPSPSPSPTPSPAGQ